MPRTPAKLLGDYLAATKALWSHAQFCQRAGISHSTLTKILGDERAIGADVGVKIAKCTAEARSSGETKVDALMLIDMVTAEVPARSQKAG